MSKVGTQSMELGFNPWQLAFKRCWSFTLNLGPELVIMTAVGIRSMPVAIQSMAVGSQTMPEFCHTMPEFAAWICDVTAGGARSPSLLPFWVGRLACWWNKWASQWLTDPTRLAQQGWAWFRCGRIFVGLEWMRWNLRVVRTRVLSLRLKGSEFCEVWLSS